MDIRVYQTYAYLNLIKISCTVSMLLGQAKFSVMLISEGSLSKMDAWMIATSLWRYGYGYRYMLD